jgi:hypothetical protein
MRQAPEIMEVDSTQLEKSCAASSKRSMKRMPR